MNIIFSFRTKPSLRRQDNEWRSPYYMLRALGLAVQEASKFGPVTFYTDDFGARLINALDMNIEVKNTLEEMNQTIPSDLYTVSKLWVYREQEQPFIHMDFDAFAFQLDPVLMQQPLFAMFPESTGNGSCYTIVDNVVDDDPEWVPNSWLAVRHRLGRADAIPYAANTGVYGCNDLDFNQKYCAEAIDFLVNDMSYIRSKAVRDVKRINIAVEQYTINSLIWAEGKHLEYMFNVGQFQIWNDKMPHLLAAEKQNVVLCKKIDRLSRVNVETALEMWTAEQKRVLAEETETLC